jgi:hypothetical protein
MAKKKEKLTKEEILKTRKHRAWDKIKQHEFSDFTEEEWPDLIRELYETMSTFPAPQITDIPYDFYEEYKDTDEIKEINHFTAHVEDTLTQVQKMKSTPTKDSWLDKDRGIIPQMKKEWKTKLDPFKNERILREKIRNKVETIFNLPENKDKKMSVDMGVTMKKALENIEETCYKPIRAKIETIEEEIKKRIK